MPYIRWVMKEQYLIRWINVKHLATELITIDKCNYFVINCNSSVVAFDYNMLYNVYRG